jgi:restriction system protein
LVERLATDFGLTEEEQAERLPGGSQATIVNRVSWAVINLARAGLLSRVRRGVYCITDRGREVLANPPERIDIRFLSKFERFVRAGNTGAEATPVEPTPALAVGTPDERIEAAFEDSNTALRYELLERVRAMDPTPFEKLIVDLMLGMGYGAGGSGQHLGRTNDGGVDGVINEDVLGLDTIYLQAKRYAEGAAIGVDKIREFAGALDERGATKGVFVTTSHFAPQARNYAERSPKRLILIDGEELTRLLVRHGVGVRVYRELKLKRLDTDYFDDLGV